MMTFCAQKMHGSAKSDLREEGDNVTTVRHFNHPNQLCHFGFGFAGLGDSGENRRITFRHTCHVCQVSHRARRRAQTLLVDQRVKRLGVTIGVRTLGLGQRLEPVGDLVKALFAR